MSRTVIQDTEEFRRMWAEEMPLAQMAERYGVTRSCISLAARRFGLPKRDRRKIADEAAFRRMWAAGVTNAEMAEHFDVSVKAISQAARRFDLPSRAGRRPRRTASAGTPGKADALPELPEDLLQRMQARGLNAALIIHLARCTCYADLRRVAEKYDLTERRVQGLWHEVRGVLS